VIGALARAWMPEAPLAAGANSPGWPGRLRWPRPPPSPPRRRVRRPRRRGRPDRVKYRDAGPAESPIGMPALQPGRHGSAGPSSRSSHTDVRRFSSSSCRTTPPRTRPKPSVRRHAARDARDPLHPPTSAPIAAFDKLPVRPGHGPPRALLHVAAADDYALPRLLEREVAVLDARARTSSACVPGASSSSSPMVAAGPPRGRSRLARRRPRQTSSGSSRIRATTPASTACYRREVLRARPPGHGLLRVRLGGSRSDRSRTASTGSLDDVLLVREATRPGHGTCA